MKKFEVQELTLCDGWVNNWVDDINGEEIPVTFDSYEEAMEELNTFLEEANEEYERGNLIFKYEMDEFRVVEVN